MLNFEELYFITPNICIVQTIILDFGVMAVTNIAKLRDTYHKRHLELTLRKVRNLNSTINHWQMQKVSTFRSDRFFDPFMSRAYKLLITSSECILNQLFVVFVRYVIRHDFLDDLRNQSGNFLLMQEQFIL